MCSRRGSFEPPYHRAVPIPQLPFRGAPPHRATWLLAQAANFDPARWKRLLPDPAWWPPEMDNCPWRTQRPIWPYLDRATVLRIGEGATEPVGAARTYVAAAAWGSDTKARTVQRRAKVLAAERLGERLADAVPLMQSAGPVVAYDALHGNGNVIRDLGPSFGTKVLYFAGYDRSAGDRQPLILDRYVAIALNRLCGFTWAENNWPTSNYEQYLDIAHSWASEWGNTTPDVIERCLFSVGKAPRLAVGALTGVPM